MKEKPSPQLSPRELQNLGMEASKEYLKNGTELQDTIKNLAVTNNLNFYQIERVVESANNSTRSALYRMPDVDQARVTFPTAEASKIMNIIKKPAEQSDIDYMLPPSQVLKDENLIEQGQKAASELGQKVASGLRIGVLNQQLKEAKAELQKIHDYRTILEQKVASARDTLESTVFQYLRSQHDVEGLAKMASTIDYNLMVDTLPIFKQAAVDKLKDRALRDEVSSLIGIMNPHLKATYVIADHPLVIRLKGYSTASADLQRSLERRDHLSRRIMALKGEIDQEEMNVPKGMQIIKEANMVVNSLTPQAGSVPIEPAATPGSGTAPKAGTGVFGHGANALFGIMDYKGNINRYNQETEDRRQDYQTEAGQQAYLAKMQQKYPKLYGELRRKSGADSWENPKELKTLQRNTRLADGSEKRFPIAQQQNDALRQVITQASKPMNEKAST